MPDFNHSCKKEAQIFMSDKENFIEISQPKCETNSDNVYLTTAMTQTTKSTAKQPIFEVNSNIAQKLVSNLNIGIVQLAALIILKNHF